MPGERFPHADSAVVRYLTTSQRLDARFPAFQTEIHGIEVQSDGTYHLPCLQD
jgi:arginine decarboxylase